MKQAIIMRAIKGAMTTRELHEACVAITGNASASRSSTLTAATRLSDHGRLVRRIVKRDNQYVVLLAKPKDKHLLEKEQEVELPRQAPDEVARDTWVWETVRMVDAGWRAFFQKRRLTLPKVPCYFMSGGYLLMPQQRKTYHGKPIESQG